MIEEIINKRNISAEKELPNIVDFFNKLNKKVSVIELQRRFYLGYGVASYLYDKIKVCTMCESISYLYEQNGDEILCIDCLNKIADSNIIDDFN